MKFIANVTPDWLENQYQRWLDDPDRFDATWQAFFTGFDSAGEGVHPPGPRPDRQSCVDCSMKQSGVATLIYRYREIGHLLACTDPLKPCLPSHPLLNLDNFELDDTDLDTVFIIPDFLSLIHI